MTTDNTQPVQADDAAETEFKAKLDKDGEQQAPAEGVQNPVADSGYDSDEKDAPAGDKGGDTPPAAA